MMETKRLDGKNSADIDTAVEILTGGGLVAVPTETVYGLAADAANPDAVRKIFDAKGRPSNHPLIVHIASADELVHWARDIPDIAFRLAAEFWPGPLTLLLKKSATVSDVVTGGLDTIGLRVPNHPMFLEILARGHSAYAAPSANPYKQLSPVSAGQVLEGLDGKIDGVLDGGFCAVGVESTILDLTRQPYRILRWGPLSQQQLAQAAGVAIECPTRHDEMVSGNVVDHYQPKTPLFLVSRQKLLDQLAKAKTDAGLAFIIIDDGPSHALGNLCVALPNDPAVYAQNIYNTLHELDKHKPSAIYCELPKGTGWDTVVDRLSRASTKS